MNNQKGKFSSILITCFLVAIIASFVFTGFTGFSLQGNKVATVGQSEVTRSEYNRALSNQLNQYTQARQGKSLTEKEIRTFGIRENVLNQLINQKLLLNYANSLGLDAGKNSVKDTMKQIYPFFFVNDKFDVNRYKTALSSNRLNPAEFEEDLINQSKVLQLNNIFRSNLISKIQAKDMFKLKNEKAKVIAVSFDKEAMTSNLPIKKSEITTFINDKNNDSIISSLYKSYQSEKMDKAKKLNEVKNELVTKHLQRTKRDELKKFNEDLAKTLEKNLANNNIKEVKSIAKKYNLTLLDNKEMSLINPTVEGISFNIEKVIPLFDSNKKLKVIKEESAITVNLLKVKNISFKKPTDDEIKKEIEFDQFRSVNALNNAVINYQKSKSKIVRSTVLQ